MRIVLADDHEVVRAGLKPFLNKLGDDVRVDEHGGLDGVLAAADSADGPVDLVIVDLKMPGVKGPASLGRVVRIHTPAPVVVLSASHAVDDILLAAREGVAGYLPKTMPGPVMVAALQLILMGERHFPASVLDVPGPAARAARTEPDAFLGPSDGVGSLDALNTKDGENPLDLLSAREREILELMMEGQTNKEIASRVMLQEITVKVHLRNIYRKMGAANRTQAVRIALENGWRA